MLIGGKFWLLIDIPELWIFLNPLIKFYDRNRYVVIVTETNLFGNLIQWQTGYFPAAILKAYITTDLTFY
jgi:hypothetical protein